MNSPVQAMEDSPKSFVARLGGILLAPSPTFADIARGPDFIYPLVTLLVSAVAVTETMLARIGMERIVRASLEQSGRAATMGPEQTQRAVEQGARVGTIIAHVAGFVALPIFLVIV